MDEPSRKKRRPKPELPPYVPDLYEAELLKKKLRRARKEVGIVKG